MTARVTKAVERSQALRAEIRHIWLEQVQRAPFAHPPTAKTIGRKLTVRLTDNAIRWHMRAIREAADAELNTTLTPRQCSE
jgi:hypothetical protein